VQYFSRPGEGESPVARVTPGEKDFLDQLAKGYAYKEIADRMTISIDTVRSYGRTVYEKLHVHSRTERRQERSQSPGSSLRPGSTSVLGPGRQWLFRLMALVLLPLMIFALLE